jgi:hypothetical protein
MKCPHLVKWLAFACDAKEKMYLPSSFQLREYCKGKYYKKCPFYSESAAVREEEAGAISAPQCQI